MKCGITGTHIEVLVNGEEEESLDLSSEENNGHSGHSHGHFHGHDHHSHQEHHEHEHEHPHHHMHQEEAIDGEKPDHEHQHHEHSHGHHSHFSMEDITGIIDGLHVDNKVKEDVKNIYQIIARAESQVHGRPVSEVHFHEVGAMDAVADITGCAMLFHELGAVKIIVSLLPPDMDRFGVPMGSFLYRSGYCSDPPGNSLSGRQDRGRTLYPYRRSSAEIFCHGIWPYASDDHGKDWLRYG